MTYAQAAIAMVAAAAKSGEGTDALDKAFKKLAAGIPIWTHEGAWCWNEQQEEIELRKILLENIEALERRLKKLEEELTLELLQGMEL